MGDVTNGADVHSGLTRDNLGVKGGDLAHVEVSEGLWSQVILSQHCFSLLRDNFLLSVSLEDKFAFLRGLDLLFYHFL